MTSFSGWRLEHRAGSAAELHAAGVPDPARRLVEVLEAAAPALVLGSAQPDAEVDRAACDAARIAVVRRRSGGGAVLVRPGDPLWIDVVVPRGDPLWDDDVGRAFLWLGDVWAAALGAAGVAGASVHRGGLERTRWSGSVCFAGLGPGEVTVGGRKVTGLSQRRTRAGARFQCAVPRVGDPADVVALLRLDDAGAAAQAVRAATGRVEVDADVLLDAFVSHLPT